MKEILIKIYFYINSGVLIVNDFRNLGLGIFALYVVLKFTNPMYLLLMTAISAPILFLMGYFNVHFISPVRERLNTKHGTHYQIKQFELIQKQTELLEEIRNKI